jgi:acetate kinase
MRVLVINSGSSSIKYQLFNAKDFTVMAGGLLEKVGEAGSRLTHHWRDASGNHQETTYDRQVRNHREGLVLVDSALEETGTTGKLSDLFAVGHRVVHGGEAFHGPTFIDTTALEAIRSLIPLAPLHNPANLAGIEASMEHMPHVPQVAVFDTSFHQTMPPHAFLYGLPYELYEEHHVRRYGFHGTSHHYVSQKAAEHIGKPLEELNLISLHLGNGASVAAISRGKSVDTSMGLTPLEGLIMGTRCGDIDPAIHFYLSRSSGISAADLESLLNHRSGLLGICGANDMRDIQKRADSGDQKARLAIDMFCYRVRKYVGAYFAVLGGADAVLFTGGMGENSPLIRKSACEGLESLGILVDERRNESASGEVAEIQKAEGRVRLLVVRTNEELEIARQTVKTVVARGRRAAPTGS